MGDILNVIFTNELHQIEWEHLISSTFIIITIIITLICKFDGRRGRFISNVEETS